MDAEINVASTHSESHKKRILFVITQSEFGGAQQFVAAFVSKLDRSRYDITVATGGTGNGEFLQALRQLGFEPLIVEELRRNESLVSDLASVLAIRNLIKKLETDTLFLCSSKAGFVGSMAARFSSRPVNVIYRIGGWSFNDPISYFEKLKRMALERLSAYWKDYIIVNNEHDFKQAKDLNIKPHRELLMIHNGIDPYKVDFLPRDEARVKLFEIMAKDWGKVFHIKNIIGTIANFYPAKGLEYLIEAAMMNDNPDTIFCIIGGGQQREKLESMIATKKLEHKVFLVGQLRNAAEYLPAFDMFILPSVKEGFPWSLLEAMAAKLPIIATSVGAVPEIIENGVNGYVVEPGEPAQIAEAIDKIMANESKAKEMAIRAHQTLVLKFGINTMVQKIESLL